MRGGDEKHTKLWNMQEKFIRNSPAASFGTCCDTVCIDDSALPGVASTVIMWHSFGGIGTISTSIVKSSVSQNVHARDVYLSLVVFLACSDLPIEWEILQERN